MNLRKKQFYSKYLKKNLTFYQNEYEKFCIFYEDLVEKHFQKTLLEDDCKMLNAYGEYFDYSDSETTMGSYCPMDYKIFCWNYKKYGEFWIKKII